MLGFPSKLLLFTLLISCIGVYGIPDTLRKGPFCRVVINGVNDNRACDHECECVSSGSACSPAGEWSKPLKKAQLKGNKNRSQEDCATKIKCAAGQEICCRKKLTTFRKGFCEINQKAAPYAKFTSDCYCENLKHYCQRTPVEYYSPFKNGQLNKIEQDHCSAKLGCDADEEPCCRVNP